MSARSWRGTCPLRGKRLLTVMSSWVRLMDSGQRSQPRLAVGFYKGTLQVGSSPAEQCGTRGTGSTHLVSLPCLLMAWKLLSGRGWQTLLSSCKTGFWCLHAHRLHPCTALLAGSHVQVTAGAGLPAYVARPAGPGANQTQAEKLLLFTVARTVSEEW